MNKLVGFKPTEKEPPIGERLFLQTRYTMAIGEYNGSEFWINGYGMMKSEDIIAWYQEID